MFLLLILNAMKNGFQSLAQHKSFEICSVEGFSYLYSGFLHGFFIRLSVLNHLLMSLCCSIWKRIGICYHISLVDVLRSYIQSPKLVANVL